MSSDLGLQRLILQQRVEDERRRLQRAVRGVRRRVWRGVDLPARVQDHPVGALAAGFTLGLLLALRRR